MSLLSQSTYTLKRVAREGYSASLTPETIALSANSAGVVQDYANAKAKVQLTYNGKEIFPVYDERLDSEIGGRNYFSPSRLVNLALSATIVGSTSYKSFYLSVNEGEVYSISRMEITNNRFRYVFTEQEPASGLTYFGGTGNATTYDYSLKIEGIIVPANAKYLFFYLTNQNDQIPNIKIEKGNKATDWSPAPEDAVGVMTTQNCTASIDVNGEVSVTNLTADAGYVDIPISYGQFSTVKRLTLAKSKQGRSIVSSTYEYAQSTSATTAPTTGWVTTPPIWIDGRYIWVRTKITYSEGSPVTTDPINLTGAGGSVGTGIDSITTEFYLSTSKTAQSGGSWSATRPAWVTGKYLWTRLKIVYKNPASTVYTTPIVSSEWEAVNDLRTELVLDYTSKLDVLEDQIEANVTETTSVKNSVSGLTTRVSQAESNLTIQANQIASKVSKTDYDSNNNAINSQISTIQQQAAQIDIKVGSMRTGGRNLLRNYNMEFGHNYWCTLIEDWVQGGFSGYSTASSSTRVRTNEYFDWPPGSQYVSIQSNYKVQIQFYNSSKTGVSNQYWKVNGDVITAPSTTRYARFSLAYADDSVITPYNAPEAKFRLAQARIIDESGTPVAPSLTVVGFVQPEAITVSVGGTINFPPTITLNISDGSTRTINVIYWGEVSTSSPGAKTSYAAYTLPAGISGTAPTVSLTIYVVAESLSVTGYVAPNTVTIYAGQTPTLPSYVTLNISDGSTRLVSVTWSSYNNITVGTQNLTATYNLPTGINGTKPNILMSLIVNALLATSVVQPSPVDVQVGGTPSLPSMITLNLNSGTTTTVPVSWSSYSTSTAGTFNLTGSYTLPSPVTGSKPSVTLTLNVTSEPVVLTITSVDQPSPITANTGDTINPPSTIVLNISDGSTRTVPVTWGAYSTATAGTFTISGTYSLPSGITGSKPSVSFTLTVAVADPNIAEKMDFIRNLPGASQGTDSYGDYVEFAISSIHGVSLMGSLQWLQDPDDLIYYYISWRVLNTTSQLFLDGYANTNPTSATVNNYISGDGKIDYDQKAISTTADPIDPYYLVELKFYSGQPNSGLVRIYNYAIGRGSNKPSWFGTSEW